MPPDNNKKIAKNTLFLYFRMFITMGVSLYTSRVVLNVLGVENYGIYNVVGGFVAIFALINGSLATASQRFITFELGKQDKQKLKETFSTTVTIHNLIALVVLILAETLSLWFFNAHMNIPQNRMNAANWVFQCSVFAFIIDILSVPYNAAIIAHEHMKAFAYVGIIEVVLKLTIVVILPFFSFDKLKFYALLTLLVAIIIRLIYSFYCKYHFEECKYKFYWNKSLFKEIGNFAGWNFIGSTSGVLMTQGVSVLLNIFYGVIVNAAQGIASQVQGAIGGFINNFMTALNPQIIKSYANNEHDYMMNLILQGARFSFYLMFFLSLPILIETEYILKLWLKIIPNYAIVFVRLSLVIALTQTLSNTLITAMHATGKVKMYQIIVGGLQLLNFPLSYLALKFGLPPQSTLIICLILSFICLAARLYLLKGMINLSIVHYLQHVLLNVFIVAFLSAIFPLIFHLNMYSGLLRFLGVCCICTVSTALVIYFIGLSASERIFINRRIFLFLRAN